MMQIKIQIEGYGSYQIDVTKLNELLGWLSKNEAARLTEQNKVREVKNNSFTGRELIND